jgi:tight adherence protein B
MYRQLDAFRDNLTNGAPESQAIAEFGSNLEFRETQLFRSILLLSRNEGSSLGQSLVRLAKVTRQRQSFERKVRSALAMQRLSTVGLVLCALFTLGFQVMTNTAAVTTALANTGGAMVMALGVVLMLVGVTWMMVISRGRVGVNK